VPRLRPVWTRQLRLYRAPAPGRLHRDADDLPDLHAHSRFRHVEDRERFAVYSIREAPLDLDGERGPGQEHTLIAVREFRRVPLDASGLGLMLFSARPGCAAQCIATLAHWVERAVSLYQPTYLLLAHALEQPRVVVLLAGVRERRTLQWAGATPFSVDLVLPEVTPLLEGPPDHYAYVPDLLPAALTTEVSPYAV
jgi:hypothetical protein